MIKAEGLTKRFDDNLAVDGLTLNVERGEVFAFLGPNGAGKTTTVRLLAALIAPTDGRAWVNGYQIGEDNINVRRSVGILTEAPGLNFAQRRRSVAGTGKERWDRCLVETIEHQTAEDQITTGGAFPGTRDPG